MFAIEYTELALEQLGEIRAFDRERLVDAIEEQLIHEPLLATRHRKELPGLAPSVEHVPPVWELRVCAWRVYYDADVTARVVFIRAVLEKGRRTTGEVVS